MKTRHHMPSMDALEELAFRNRAGIIKRGDVWECRVGRSTYWFAA